MLLGRQDQKTFRTMDHGEMIKKILTENAAIIGDDPVFVETGCGLSTVSLAEMGTEMGATVYSCDYNKEKADELRQAVPEKVKNINYMIGDSIESLEKIASKHSDISFLFLDSAASAMHTFREFMAVEKCLHPGSIVLIDNAALPGEKRVLSPVRKGKVIVPYLLASTNWEVNGHPSAGDSMVSAIMHKEHDFADSEYEHPEYVDNWKSLFDKKLSSDS